MTKWFDSEQIIKELKDIEDPMERAKQAHDLFEEIRALALTVVNDIQVSSVEEVVFHDDDDKRLSQAEVARRLGVHPSVVRKKLRGEGILRATREVKAKAAARRA